MYKLTDDLAIVQSVDFFSPIVDDPYTFGRIAAANALSDLYTMAARPITALNIVAFPCELGLDVAAEIMEGGAKTIAEAGAALLGGHSVEDKEPKYGLAVTGTVNPKKMITNVGARQGDAVILTKKIGTGIICNTLKPKNTLAGAIKRHDKSISKKVIAEMIESMTRLNRNAAHAMMAVGVSACTDVTGYGLLGHALNIAEASKVRLVISHSMVPTFDGLLAHAIAGTKGGGERNYAWVKKKIDPAPGLKIEKIMVLCDAQTSGGLLISVPQAKANKLLTRIRDGGDEVAAIIGHVEKGEPGTIEIRE